MEDLIADKLGDLVQYLVFSVKIFLCYLRTCIKLCSASLTAVFSQSANVNSVRKRKYQHASFNFVNEQSG